MARDSHGRRSAHPLFRGSGPPVLRGRPARGLFVRRERLHVLGTDVRRRPSRLPRVRLRAEPRGNGALRLQAPLGVRTGTASLSIRPPPRSGASQPQSLEPPLSTRHADVEAPSLAPHQAPGASPHPILALTMRILMLAHRLPYPPRT